MMAVGLSFALTSSLRELATYLSYLISVEHWRV